MGSKRKYRCVRWYFRDPNIWGVLEELINAYTQTKYAKTDGTETVKILKGGTHQPVMLYVVHVMSEGLIGNSLKCDGTQTVKNCA